MRCPDCETRNSVAARKCSSCGHKFKGKPVPWPIWAGLGVLVCGAGAWGVASAVVPNLNDPSQKLSHIARRVAAGPASPEDAKQQEDELDREARTFISNNAKLPTQELVKKLQATLSSSAFEAHGFDLPRSLRIFEIDTILQARDYLVIGTASGAKVISIPGLEVFDSAQVVKDATGSSLVLIGHTAGQTAKRPQIKVYAMLPDDVRDETANSVPHIAGDGGVTFAPNRRDIIADLNVFSVAVAEHIFKPIPPGSDKFEEETAREDLIWRDGRYTLHAAVGRGPLSALYVVSKCLQKPSLVSGYSSYLGNKATRFISNTSGKIGIPNFSVCKVTVMGKHRTGPQVGRLLLGGEGKNFLVDLQSTGKDADSRVIANNVSKADPDVVTWGLQQNPQIASSLRGPEDPATNPHQAAIIEKKVDAKGDANQSSGTSIEDKIISNDKKESQNPTSQQPESRDNSEPPRKEAAPVTTATAPNIGVVPDRTADAKKPDKPRAADKTASKTAEKTSDKFPDKPPAPIINTASLGPPPKLKNATIIEISKPHDGLKGNAKPAPITIQTTPNSPAKPLTAAATGSKPEADTKPNSATASKNGNANGTKPAIASAVPGANQKNNPQKNGDTDKSKTRDRGDKSDKSKSADSGKKPVAEKPIVEKSAPDKAPAADTEPAGGSQTAHVASRISGTVRVRVGPGAEYREIASVGGGSPITILGEKNGWYKVRASGRVGYILGTLVQRPGGAPPVAPEAADSGASSSNDRGSRHSRHHGYDRSYDRHGRHSKDKEDSNSKKSAPSAAEPPAFVP